MYILSDSNNGTTVTTDATPTVVTQLDVSSDVDMRDLSAFYALVDALGSAITLHLSETYISVHENGVDVTALALIQPTPPTGDLWRYFAYLNSLVLAVVDHATRVDGNVHVEPDGSSFSVLNTLPLATDISSAVVLANELKVGVNAHFGNLSSHSDETPTVVTPDAVDGAYYPSVGKATISILAIEESTSDSRVWEYKMCYKMNSSGTLTEVASEQNISDLADAGAAAWSASIGVSGGSVQVTVTGEVGKSISWLGTIQTVVLSLTT